MPQLPTWSMPTRRLVPLQPRRCWWHGRGTPRRSAVGLRCCALRRVPAASHARSRYLLVATRRRPSASATILPEVTACTAASARTCSPLHATPVPSQAPHAPPPAFHRTPHQVPARPSRQDRGRRSRKTGRGEARKTARQHVTAQQSRCRPTALPPRLCTANPRLTCGVRMCVACTCGAAQLLAADVLKENFALLQCIRYFVANRDEFFGASDDVDADIDVDEA